jgi:hypothetical protein
MSKREKSTPHDTRDEDHGSVSIDWSEPRDTSVSFPDGLGTPIGPEGNEGAPLNHEPNPSQDFFRD